MNIDNTINKIASRQGVASISYDEESAKRKLAEREAKLQAEINLTLQQIREKESRLLYSHIPNKFREMEFSDLTITADNKKIIDYCSKYVKNYESCHKGIALLGDMGVGKTTLMAIMGQKLIKDYQLSVYFATEDALLDEIRRAYDDDSLDNPEDIIRRIGEHDVVMIDELGQTTTDWGIATLKRVVDTVISNNTRLFATTNYNSTDLGERWKASNKNKTPKQVIDRLGEAMDFYLVKGESFRRIINA